VSEAHTPGPWILATLPTSVGSCHKIGPFPAAGSRPYTFACVYADGIRPGIDDDLLAAKELAANARLIAAAPDLLAACETAFHQTCSVGRPKDWEQLRAAIAKAIGSNQA
jgi:hypothetical protein